MKSSTKTGAPKKAPVDPLFRNVTRTLIRDFQNNLEDPCFSDDVLMLLKQDVKALREVKNQGLDFSKPVNEFKYRYQILSLDKRYRYSKDAYTDDELEEQAIRKFLDVQTRLGEVNWEVNVDDENTSRLLRLARRFCHAVLGGYDAEELRQCARFGPGASVGIKARDAHLAQRFLPPITGTPEQISWWRSEYDHCPHFRDWLVSLGIDPSDEKQMAECYKEVHSLNLTFVPKNHKSLRSILANTTIGSYISGGLGVMIERRLKRKVKLDIKRLQHIHRDICQYESVFRSLCTVDLSSASDTISSTLAELLLPDDWFNALSVGRCGRVELPNGSVIDVETFSTMGIGFTFTLQTLIFYALVWAVRGVEEILPMPPQLRRAKTTISAYGDDLIFGSRYYPQVKELLGKLGILVNEDKSFVKEPFRESCGGDYYRGRDVRPFQPEVDKCSVLVVHEYEALIYKFINGLRRRFPCDYEIWSTLRFLVAELERHGVKPALVPNDYPEDSGIRVSGNWIGAVVLPEFLRGVRYEEPKDVGHGLRRFRYLKKHSQRKEELRHGPYYWSSIRNVSLTNSNEFGRGHSYDEPARLLPLASPLVVKEVGKLHVKLERFCEPGQLITAHVTPEVAPDFVGPVRSWRAVDKRPPCQTLLWELRPQADYVAIPHTAKYRSQKGISMFRERLAS